MSKYKTEDLANMSLDEIVLLLLKEYQNTQKYKNKSDMTKVYLDSAIGVFEKRQNS